MATNKKQVIKKHIPKQFNLIDDQQNSKKKKWREIFVISVHLFKYLINIYWAMTVPGMPGNEIQLNKTDIFPALQYHQAMQILNK